jgi:hypothetical protein
VIVENATSPQADFSYWRDSEQCIRFREAFRPVVLSMEYRLADLEAASGWRFVPKPSPYTVEYCVDLR